MFFKNVILDLDGTLYCYESIHKKILNEILTNDEFNIYFEMKKHSNINLSNTASSHNKFINFKKLCEHYNYPYNKAIELDKLYWDKFFEYIKLNDGCLNFLNFCKSNNIKLCLLTNFTTKEQFYKLNKLNILEYFDYILTSEEIGKEKPCNELFYNCLNKCNMNTNDTIMIGDSYTDDIYGASNCNIYSFYFNQTIDEIKINNNYLEFPSFIQLNIFLKNINENLIKLENISKYCGMRFDLVQAGGGNTSFKYNNLLFVKASGYNLSEITKNDGYVVLYNNIKLLKYRNKKESIETPLHLNLFNYIIHLHPIQVNNILINKNAKEILKKIFSNILIIDYKIPGIELANEINKYWTGQKIIFLLNHGLIVTSNNYNEILPIIEDILLKCEKYSSINMDKYKNTTLISKKYNNSIVYYSDIKLPEKLFNTNPDKIVFCGDKIYNYNDNYEFIPKIVKYENNTYLLAKSLKKCKEIEDVLRANILLQNNCDNINELNKSDIEFINNWELEKYRFNLN